MSWFPGKPRDGAAYGIRFGGSGGGSSPAGNTVQTSNQQPWAPQQPYLQQGFADAYNLLGKGGPQYFPGQTYSPETQAQSGAITGLENLGLNGTPVTGAANSAVTNILNPNFLNSNPGNSFYNQVLSGNSPAINAAVANATPGLLDSFTGGGAVTAGSAAPYAVGKGVGNAVANAMGSAAQGLSQNYGQAATQQNQALAYGAPEVNKMSVGNLETALGAGGAQQQLGQNVINDQVARFNYNQTQPYNLVDWYNGAVGGNYGSTGSLTTPYFQQASNPWGGALTGAASGASMGSMFGPWGTAIGGIGGGLLGGLSS